MSIECMEFKSYESGALQGFANFRMTLNSGMAFELFGCGVFMKDGKRWVGMPSREYQDRETNEKKYISIFRFCDKSHTESFCKAALQSMDTWCDNNTAPAQSFSQPAIKETKDNLPF